jgi:2-polyprenyl-3-methyl-5-hydroxy-6-metoxy-1,4-benzoquinol methylase
MTPGAPASVSAERDAAEAEPAYDGDFDQRAATWDDNPLTVQRAAAVALAVRSAVPLSPTAKVLEYGAGTGLVSESLSPHVGSVTVADTSVGMREVLGEKVRAGVLPHARIWDVDLTGGVAPPEEFDLIVTVMAMHHMPRIDVVLDCFAAMLRPGGHVCIVDLDEEDGSFHGAGFDGHRGFEREGLRSTMVRSGFTNVSIEDFQDVIRGNGAFTLFLAIGERRAD